MFVSFFDKLSTSWLELWWNLQASKSLTKQISLIGIGLAFQSPFSFCCDVSSSPFFFLKTACCSVIYFKPICWHFLLLIPVNFCLLIFRLNFKGRFHKHFPLTLCSQIQTCVHLKFREQPNLEIQTWTFSNKSTFPNISIEVQDERVSPVAWLPFLEYSCNLFVKWHFISASDYALGLD